MPSSHIVKHCNGVDDRCLQIHSRSDAATRTVLRSATELMLDAFRELDENEQDGAQERSAVMDTAPTVYFIDDQRHHARGDQDRLPAREHQRGRVS